MNRILRYSIAFTFAFLLLPVAHCAPRTNAERLAMLRPLIQYDLPFHTNVSQEDIIAWEKFLSPDLELRQQYDTLFQVKAMAVQALINEGNLSLALANATAMYQRAKELNFPFGTALSLRALGNAYAHSLALPSAMRSYNEAMEIMQNIPAATPHLKNTLAQVILIRLKWEQPEDLTDIQAQIAHLEQLCSKQTDSSTYFYLTCCRVVYAIQSGEPEQAHQELQHLQQANAEQPYPYFLLLTEYFSALYYAHIQEYNLALELYNKVMPFRRAFRSYGIHVYHEQADLFEAMGLVEEACDAYEHINAVKDSINELNYFRQIDEMHATYQVDKDELLRVELLRVIIYWSCGISAVALFLIIFSIIYIRRGNKRLLFSLVTQEATKRQAENSIRTKSLFLSNMSHEIRTPLNALSGFSGILTEESIDEETRKQCNDIILQNSKLLLKLIDDVVDLSSLELGKMTFRFETCDAVELCRNVTGMVEKIKQTHADILFESPLQELPMHTDSGRLQQVLINLLINATKYTSQGSITLRLEQQTEEMAFFSVTDTGTGIPREKQANIFNRFEKVNENVQGTGIGLSICQIIIDHLGGRIWIDPDYEQGSRFCFTHPIHLSRQGKEDTL